MHNLIGGGIALFAAMLACWFVSRHMAEVQLRLMRRMIDSPWKFTPPWMVAQQVVFSYRLSRFSTRIYQHRLMAGAWLRRTLLPTPIRMRQNFKSYFKFAPSAVPDQTQAAVDEMFGRIVVTAERLIAESRDESIDLMVRIGLTIEAIHYLAQFAAARTAAEYFGYKALPTWQDYLTMVKAPAGASAQ